MMQICDPIKCTGCNACVNACPKQCIELAPDKWDILRPIIDESKCVNCRRCQNVCPNNTIPKFNLTKHIYAAWNRNDDERRTSASGGIATELYKYGLEHGWNCYGVVIDRSDCYFKRIESINDLKKVKNSKYVYSSTNRVYGEINQLLKNNEFVLFIGLPCQVAGLLTFLGKSYKKLYVVDLVCHGVTPFSYLNKHISYIENRVKRNSKNILFRDPEFYTYTYTFTLKDSNDCLIYKKSAEDIDNYQLGYHKALTYRENCYYCSYARRERVADLTIGDYYGISDKYGSFPYSHKKVSCILENTAKGQEVLNLVKDSLVIVERSMDELYAVERQLNAPSTPHPQRDIFLEEYGKDADFEMACKIALRAQINDIRKSLFLKKVKIFIKGFLKKSEYGR